MGYLKLLKRQALPQTQNLNHRPCESACKRHSRVRHVRRRAVVFGRSVVLFIRLFILRLFVYLFVRLSVFGPHVFCSASWVNFEQVFSNQYLGGPSKHPDNILRSQRRL